MDRHRDGRRRDNRSRSRERERKPRDRSRSPRRHRSRSRSPARRRSRSRSPDRDGKKKRRRSRSSSSSSDSDRGHRRRRRRSRSRSRSRSRERKDKKDKKRKHKKDKKKKGTVASEWGKFGIINDSDLYNKDPEFRAWLLEEQKINPETISKDQTRKQFAKYVEDYNTGTLPHEKYYNLSRYEARMSLVRSGEALPPDDIGYDFSADIAAHSSAIKRGSGATKEAQYSKEELQELRRVQNERVQLSKMKVLGMDIKTSMGVRMVDNDAFDPD